MEFHDIISLGVTISTPQTTLDGNRNEETLTLFEFSNDKFFNYIGFDIKEKTELKYITSVNINIMSDGVMYQSQIFKGKVKLIKDKYVFKYKKDGYWVRI